MNEDKDRDKLEELLKQELLEEAEAIRAEVNQRKELENVTAPDELEEKIRKQIQKIEAEHQAQENLSMEGKETMRLGREAQIQRNLELLDVEEEPVFIRRKRPWKVVLLVAAIATLLLATGLTSLGGPPFILDMMEDVLGEREVTKMDSEREGGSTNTEDIGEEEKFYQEVKETFGINAVRMFYTPSHAQFLMGDIDKESSQVCILYLCEENTLEYQIIVNVQARAYGYDIEDELVSEDVLVAKDTPITMKEYKLPDGSHQFVAQFEYENNAYILNSTIAQEEFEKIVKNLRFY